MFRAVSVEASVCVCVLQGKLSFVKFCTIRDENKDKVEHFFFYFLHNHESVIVRQREEGRQSKGKCEDRKVG